MFLLSGFDACLLQPRDALVLSRSIHLSVAEGNVRVRAPPHFIKTPVHCNQEQKRGTFVGHGTIVSLQEV